MWPKSWSTVTDPDFEPSVWEEKLYPIIDHTDDVEKEAHEQHKHNDLAIKVNLMNEKMTKTGNKPDVDKDVLQLLTIQTELINQLLNRVKLLEEKQETNDR
jgi:hypothetical protein